MIGAPIAEGLHFSAFQSLGLKGWYSAKKHEYEAGTIASTTITHNPIPISFVFRWKGEVLNKKT